MPIYLARHGEAAQAPDDAVRPLSERGRTEVERVAGLAAELGLRPARIHHSGLLRARQTADILAGRLQPAGGVEARAGLGPDDDPERLAVECEVAREPLMLVGHLPHLSRLASRLLVGDARRGIIRFRTGTIVGLVKGDGGFLVDCVIRPHAEERP
jgi:phosphohistidine phosphatase